jgi:hypothetical protein
MDPQARYFTVQDAARLLCISAGRVRQIALAHSIGFKVHRLLRLFTLSDLSRLGECQAPMRGPYFNSRRPRPAGETVRVRAQNEPPEFRPEYWRT